MFSRPRKLIPRALWLVGGVTATLLFAPPASADEAGYLHALNSQFASVSDQQLIAEGAKICNATRGGDPSSDAVVMVQKDLRMGVPEAVQVVAAAVVHLGC